MNDEENLTLHQKSLKALFHTPLQLCCIDLLELINHDRPCYVEIVSTHLLHANMLQNSKQQNTPNKLIMFDMFPRERQRTAFLLLNQKSASKDRLANSTFNVLGSWCLKVGATRK